MRGSVALTRRAVLPRLQLGGAACGDVSAPACSGQKAAKFSPGFAGPAPGRWLRVQPQVRQDILDHRPLEHGRDDLQFSGTTVRAGVHVDIEDALEQPCPTDAARPRLGGLGLAPCGRRVRQPVPRANALPAAPPAPATWHLGASTPWNRIRCSLGRGAIAARRCMASNSSLTKRGSSLPVLASVCAMKPAACYCTKRYR